MSHFEREPIAGREFAPVESREDELDDDFDPFEYHEVRHLVERALKRGEHYRAARLIKDVREARTERSIRKRMVSSLEASGGTMGIERLMHQVCESEGASAMNATLCLVYIMQEEGKLAITIPEDRDEILVELIRRRHTIK